MSIVALDRPTIPTIAELDSFIAGGWINAQRHPTLPLTIYNYSHKTQFARNWTPETRVCRGLILADDGTVVARPFPKFFNLGEHEDALPDEPFHVYEKLDGSLFIVAVYDGELVTATRGSFTGVQAVAGRLLLDEMMDREITTWGNGWTYCFELIYPENRIVVDYGDRRDLVLLDIIETATGRAVPDEDRPEMPAFRKAERYEVDFRNPPPIANAEGYVIHFTGPSDLRVKVKFDEYVRLHRLLTGVNARTIWEHLSSGQAFDDLIAKVPDEFYAWVQGIVSELRAKYDAIEAECQYAMSTVPTEDRRASAECIKQQAYPSVCFAMLDAKDHAPMIWKLIKPEASRPFKTDES